MTATLSIGDPISKLGRHSLLVNGPSHFRGKLVNMDIRIIIMNKYINKYTRSPHWTAKGISLNTNIDADCTVICRPANTPSLWCHSVKQRQVCEMCEPPKFWLLFLSVLNAPFISALLQHHLGMMLSHTVHRGGGGGEKGGLENDEQPSALNARNNSFAEMFGVDEVFIRH